MDIDRFKKGARLLNEANDLLRLGPLQYSLEQLALSYELLLSRFSPFKPGDRIKLAKTPEIEIDRNSGWYGSRHFLKAGASGEVCDSSCVDGKFRFEVIFDDESYVDIHGVVCPITENRHSYCFGEDFLTPEA